MSCFYFPEQIKEDAEFPYQIVEMGYHFCQLGTFRPGGLREYQFVYCVSGKGIFKFGNQKFEISSGMGFFTAPHTPQEYYAIENDWIVHYVVLNGFGVEPYVKSMNLSNYQIIHAHNPFYLENYFRSLYNCIQNRKDNWRMEASVILYAMLSLFQSVKPYDNSESETSAGKLTHVIRYIADNYANAITLQDLAKFINVSPSYLCQLFKKTYKTSPVEYINQFRIQKAKDLLYSNHTLPVYKISELVGFSDTSYFCRIFKKQEGVTPSQFRENSFKA